MPIYEFYCRNCHTVYNFFARRVDTQATPACPKNSKHKLQRQMSRFAISSGQASPAEGGGPELDMDEDRLEQAMIKMAGEFDSVDESNPVAMAHMMRRLMDTTGMNMGEGMEEAVRRMEAGEDPDKVEEDLGAVMDSEDPFSTGEGKLQGLARRMIEAPEVDPEIYDM